MNSINRLAVTGLTLASMLGCGFLQSSLTQPAKTETPQPNRLETITLDGTQSFYSPPTNISLLGTVFLYGYNRSSTDNSYLIAIATCTPQDCLLAQAIYQSGKIGGRGTKITGKRIDLASQNLSSNSAHKRGPAFEIYSLESGSHSITFKEQ